MPGRVRPGPREPYTRPSALPASLNLPNALTEMGGTQHEFGLDRTLRRFLRATAQQGVNTSSLRMRRGHSLQPHRCGRSTASISRNGKPHERRITCCRLTLSRSKSPFAMRGSHPGKLHSITRQPGPESAYRSTPKHRIGSAIRRRNYFGIRQRSRKSNVKPLLHSIDCVFIGKSGDAHPLSLDVCATTAARQSGRRNSFSRGHTLSHDSPPPSHRSFSSVSVSPLATLRPSDRQGQIRCHVPTGVASQ